jgi:hypothetical protein
MPNLEIHEISHECAPTRAHVEEVEVALDSQICKCRVHWHGVDDGTILPPLDYCSRTQGGLRKKEG